MLLKLKILAKTFASASLLLLVLCLGSQNLKDKKSIQVGTTKTEKLPAGFVVGVSLIFGVISGGSAAALLITKDDEKT